MAKSLKIVWEAKQNYSRTKSKFRFKKKTKSKFYLLISVRNIVYLWPISWTFTYINIKRQFWKWRRPQIEIKQEKKSYENSKIKRKTYARKLSWVIDSNTNYILNIAIDLNIKWVEAKKPKEINTKLKKIVSMSNLTFFKSVLNCAEGSWDLIVEKLGSGFPCNCQPEKQKQFSVIGRRWKLWSGGCLFKTETCSIVGLWKIKTEKQKTEEKTLVNLQ